jgi:hypothetical protein
MLKLPLVLLYTAMTFLAWGIYGILLNYGQKGMGGAFLKPFVGVGFAYFVIAVLGAGAMLGGTKEKGHWSFAGTILSLIAGAVGALGAFGVILALAFGGEPVYVMPLIFGGAPVVNTLFTSWLGKTFNKITPLFVIGMILVGVGMVGVLSKKPHSPKPHTDPAKATSIHVAPSSNQLSFASFDSSAGTKADVAVTTDKPGSSSPVKTTNYLYVVLSVVMAIICWGSYGPVLHLGQMKMGGSRLRPFCCVGLAYFLIAVLLPLSILSIDRVGSAWTMPGMLWSVAAGTAGAIGALGIILAFNYGGKPIFVMPLVFGFAPVINTLTTLWLSNQLHKVDPLFAASLATVIAGAVMVLIFAPKSKHGPPPKPEIVPAPSPTVASNRGIESTTSTPPTSDTASPAPSSPSPADSTDATTPSEPKS